MTNNPDKVSALRELGVDVRRRVATVLAAQADNAAYLECKRVKLGHRIPPSCEAATLSVERL